MLSSRPPLLLLTFHAAGHLFVLDVHRVHELLRAVNVAPLPGAHPAVRGLFGWRGRSIPLLSLQALLQAPGQTLIPPPRRVVVLQAEGHTLGLGVDGVDEVVSCGPDELLADGQDLLAQLSPFVLGCCLLGARRALMLDVRPLVSLVGQPSVASLPAPAASAT